MNAFRTSRARAARAATPLLALALAGACAPALTLGAFGDPATTAPPPAHAAPAALGGRWEGTYAAPTFARRGRVAVTFGPSADAAAAGWLTLTDAAPGAVRVPLRSAVAEGGGVTVRSEPYWDGDCGCTVTLTLTARQHGDTLAGAFSARAAATAAAEPRGRWRVVRVARGAGGRPVGARLP